MSSLRREAMLERAARDEPFDLVVIGGGATGVGVAVDAASRGYATLLLEGSDFGKGTSSRSTKLVHGGVRYLKQGNVSLVMEALEERGLLRRNAPHLVSELRFVVPSYDWWEGPFYGIGLKVYDILAGRYGFGLSRLLSSEETLEYLPTLRDEDLRGGILYYDAQFDDARLLVSLCRTAAAEGAVLVNHAPVEALHKSAAGLVDGVRARDLESGATLDVRARAVISATGAFTDRVLALDEPAVRPVIAPSQGAHLVLDRRFLPGDSAIMVPRTRDGRIVFAIPWHNRVVVGTTETPMTVDQVSLEPCPRDEEVDFLLEAAGRYLEVPPGRGDVLSAFAGIRPLIRSGARTAELSREHVIHITRSGLVVVGGGKWTTYRAMAEEVVDRAAVVAELEERPSVTRTLRIHGYTENPREGVLACYGTDAAALDELVRTGPGLGERLHERLPYRGSEVVWAVRHEMARTLDDVLARRTRALQLDARAARELAPRTAALMAVELGRDGAWQRDQVASFDAIARGYIVSETGGAA